MLTANFTPPFQAYFEVTQGEPFPPKIFNMAVDSVIRHWVEVVVTTEAVEEELRETIQELAVLFYADDGLVVSPRP